MTNEANVTNRVTLPKEVAAAISDVRRYYRDSEIIATIESDRGCSAYSTKMPVLIRYHRQDEGNIGKLMGALVNGYQVEKSPEEKVRELYDGWAIGGYCHGRDRKDIDIATGAIRETLDLLGIKIEGVNA